MFYRENLNIFTESHLNSTAMVLYYNGYIGSKMKYASTTKTSFTSASNQESRVSSDKESSSQRKKEIKKIKGVETNILISRLTS